MKNADVFNDNIHIMGKGNKERFVAKSPYMAKVLLRYYRFR